LSSFGASRIAKQPRDRAYEGEAVCRGEAALDIFRAGFIVVVSDGSGALRSKDRRFLLSGAASELLKEPPRTFARITEDAD
jgi:hypothetical protein